MPPVCCTPPAGRQTSKNCTPGPKPGLRKEEIPAAPPYIRVLGFNRRGQAVLKDMNARASLPVFVKPAHVRRLSTEAQAVFALEDRFTDLFSLCFSNPLPCGLEWTTNPVIHPDRKM